MGFMTLARVFLSFSFHIFKNELNNSTIHLGYSNDWIRCLSEKLFKKSALNNKSIQYLILKQALFSKYY